MRKKLKEIAVKTPKLCPFQALVCNLDSAKMMRCAPGVLFCSGKEIPTHCPLRRGAITVYLAEDAKATK